MVDLINLPRPERRYEGDTGDWPTCIICGRPIKARPKYLHVVGGGTSVLLPADEGKYTSDAGDMYYHPVGTGCLKKHPQLKRYAINSAGLEEDGCQSAH
jgi:hypothetical protein